MEIGGEANGGIPAVGDEANPVLLGHPADAPFFGNAAHLGDIRLDDVECASGQERGERLAAGQYLATGDGHGRLATQDHVVIERIWREGFLEPVDVVLGQHVSGA